MGWYLNSQSFVHKTLTFFLRDSPHPDVSRYLTVGVVELGNWYRWGALPKSFRRHPGLDGTPSVRLGVLSCLVDRLIRICFRTSFTFFHTYQRSFRSNTMFRVLFTSGKVTHRHLGSTPRISLVVSRLLHSPMSDAPRSTEEVHSWGKNLYFKVPPKGKVRPTPYETQTTKVTFTSWFYREWTSWDEGSLEGFGTRW